MVYKSGQIFLRFVTIHACDRRTARILIARPRLYSMQRGKNCEVHYGASHTTSGYDCRNKCVFSFQRNNNSDVAVVTSRGRVFQILGPAEDDVEGPSAVT